MVFNSGFKGLKISARPKISRSKCQFIQKQSYRRPE